MFSNEQFLPKYQLFANDIKNKISSGELVAGAPLPSMRKLMKTNKVSQPTVEKGLKILLQFGLLKHHDGRGYSVADNSSSESTLKQIAYITPMLASDTNLYIEGVRDALVHKSYACSTFSTNADMQKFQHTLDQVVQLKPAGIILHTISDDIYHLDVSSLIDSGIPIVALAESQPQLLCDRVLVSTQAVIEKVVSYIIKKKLNNLMMLTETPSTAEEMITAFRDKLSGTAINLSDDRIFMYDSSHGYSADPDQFIDAELKMTELIKNGFTSGTLICSHDYPAIGALRAILKAGIKVPEEMKIISIMSCAINGHSPMKLTTVNYHPAERARIATKLLINRIDGYSGPLEMHYVGGDIIEGETT